jgi:hypothetical protein
MSSCRFKCLKLFRNIAVKGITNGTNISLTIIFADYDDKVCCKLKCTFMIVNYDRSTFTLQAQGACDVKLFTAVIYGFL